MCVKALQDRCVAKERVVTRVRKHNTNLLDEQKQYKEALRTLNAELKETREKLEGAGLRKKELDEGLTTLRQQVEMAGADAVQKFKASQSYVDSCADYYGTRYDDCLKQVASVFPELDLFGITMDDLKLTTPVGDVVDESDGAPETNPPSKADGVIVLAQLAANPPPVSTSNPTVVLVDVENPHSKKDNGNPTDTPTA